MARLPLAVPPGVVRRGTEYTSKGAYYDAQHVRWYPSLGPTGGWRTKTATTLTGVPRAALIWNTNSAVSWLGVGTHSKLYVMTIAGVVSDVTPTSSYTAGRADAVASGGYGSGTYGTGVYGAPRPGNAEILDATQWTLAPWGEDLLAVSPEDGKLRQWDSSSGVGTVAATVTNSPACKAVCVTAERFVFALATTDPRTVDWCDQENNTVWTPSGTNQAGSFPLQTAGRLMCGAQVRGGQLLLTDQDAHIAQYVGGIDVYGFQKAGDACGAASRQALATFDQQAVWMSPSVEFWAWNGGGVVPLPCDVIDYIRRDINLLQISKVVLSQIAAHSEIEVRYCSNSSLEIDRCVVWNYKGNYWNIGRASRTAAVDKGASFRYPIQISSTGTIYEHEVGFDYGSDTPYATAGNIELGNSDKIMHVLGLYPDDATEGDVTATFLVRRNQDDAGATFGPYSLTAKTDLRFCGGLIEVKWVGDELTDWRVGIPKLEVMAGEGR